MGVLTVHHEEERRRVARAAVNATPGFESLGEAASAEEALELALALRPALALVGTSMPGIDGFEASAWLVSALPDIRVVLLYDSTQPNGNALAEAHAVTAMHSESLAPGTLRALWEKHRTE